MNFNPQFVDPPGSYIREELEARGWSQRDLAYVLGIAEQQLSPILSGKRAITPDMARALGDAFDVPAEFFSNLQKFFDLSQAKEPDPAIKKRAALQSVYPVREMIRRGWLEDADAALMELQFVRFFEGQVPQFAAAAKKTNYEEEPPTQIAWLYRVRQLAKLQDAPRYSPEALQAALSTLKSYAIEAEGVKEATRLLNACGVRIVFVEALPGARAKIDGVCTWIDGGEAPVIGMSLTHDRMDNFWFVLRHEIEHVLRGEGMLKAVLDNLEGDAAGEGSDLSEQERRANIAAADFCVPRDKMRSFYARKAPYIAERDVVGFAALMNVHPALVVGQLHNLMRKYTHFRKYLTPVRKHIVESSSAEVDGWGVIATADL